MEKKQDNTDIRIVFLGTPDFAVASLHALLQAGCNVVGVVTAPDRPAGRGYKLQESAVKQYAVKHNLPVLQPTNLKSPEFTAELKALQADLQIVVAFRMLPESVWGMPRLGTFNLHASLLPQYRGAAPINWAVINGETETGVTTFFLTHEIDTGAIIDQVRTPIGDTETAGELHDRLMLIGSELVVRTVDKIRNGNVKTTSQNEIRSGDLKSAPKLNREIARINWDQPVKQVFDHIRGLSPYPGAWTFIQLESDTKQLTFKLFDIAMNLVPSEPGHVYLGQERMEIGCIGGRIVVLAAQLEGKKRMPVEDLLRGTKFQTNQTLN